MRDQVTMAIARALSVSSNSIGEWELTATTKCDHIGRIGSAGLFTTRGVRAALEVDVFFDRVTLERVRAMSGSVQMDEYRPAEFDYPGAEARPGPLRTKAKLQLLYGKETQHIFKALHQLMTVRGPQKRKKRK